jgi:predicted DNA-binding transcriptional regulator AlpA
LAKLLTTTDVGDKLGFSSVTIHNRVAAGTFPKPTEVNGRVRYWSVAAVNKWKAENRDLLKSMQRRKDARPKAKKSKATRKKKAA